MDPTTLVSRDQIRGGEDLLSALSAHGVPVTGAAWARIDDNSRPYLYIVFPDAETDGLIAVAGRFAEVFRAVEPTWDDPFRRLGMFDARLLRPSDRFAQAILRETAANRGRATLVRRDTLGGVSVEGGAYLYPTSLFAAPAPQA